MSLTPPSQDSPPQKMEAHPPPKESLWGTLAALDRKIAIVTVTAALALTIQHFGMYPSVFAWLVAALELPAGWCGLWEWQQALHTWSYTILGSLFWWAFISVATYFFMPTLVIWLILRERVRDYGIKLPGAFAGLPIYLGMVGLMIPLVIIVSAEEHFQQTYPFYPLARGEKPGPSFWIWELLYATQFFGLEFFFRGFMVLGTRHRFGPNAIFYMVVPYCMIHYQKPMAEAFASIIAGVALGLMSYRTRSVWLGAGLHVTVAWTMDLTMLYRAGSWP